MKIIIVMGAICFSALLAFAFGPKLNGKWQFVGGIYNGKPEGEPQEYKLQRVYTDKAFTAYVIATGSKPDKYQSGKYNVTGSDYAETETYSQQPSKLTNKTVHYQFQIRNDSLILRAKLPTGMQVEEYWVRLKK